MWFADVPWSIIYPPAPIVIKKTIIKPVVPVIPASLQVMIQIPRADQAFEFAAVRYVAKQLGYHFSYSGPDYALWDTSVTFGAPIMAGKFLEQIGQIDFLPTKINVNTATKIISVVNLGPLDGPNPEKLRYIVTNKGERTWTFHIQKP